MSARSVAGCCKDRSLAACSLQLRAALLFDNCACCCRIACPLCGCIAFPATERYSVIQQLARRTPWIISKRNQVVLLWLPFSVRHHLCLHSCRKLMYTSLTIQVQELATLLEKNIFLINVECQQCAVSTKIHRV